MNLDPLVIQEDREAYCGDGNGHEVTPIVNESQVQTKHYPPDVLHLTQAIPRGLAKGKLTQEQKTELDAFRAFMEAHGHGDTGHGRDARVESKEVLRALADRKAKMGPGLDKGGCTLVTQEMRETFVQNPGVRRVVPLDY